MTYTTSQEKMQIKSDNDSAVSIVHEGQDRQHRYEQKIQDPAAEHHHRRVQRRSSLLGDKNCPRRAQRRRSSVTFAPSDEVREVPKSDPVENTEMFYSERELRRFRREHARERWELQWQQQALSQQQALRQQQQQKGNLLPQDRRQCSDNAAAAAAAAAPRITFSHAKSSTPKAAASPSSSRRTATLRVASRGGESAQDLALRFSRLAMEQQSRSYTYAEGMGFDVPLNAVRDHCVRRGGVLGQSMVKVSLPNPVKPAVRTARLA